MRGKFPALIILLLVNLSNQGAVIPQRHPCALGPHHLRSADGIQNIPGMMGSSIDQPTTKFWIQSTVINPVWRGPVRAERIGWRDRGTTGDVGCTRSLLMMNGSRLAGLPRVAASGMSGIARSMLR
jgi:hypothetical protein